MSIYHFYAAILGIKLRASPIGLWPAARVRPALAADRAPLLGEGAEQMHLVDAASKIRGPE